MSGLIFCAKIDRIIFESVKIGLVLFSILYVGSRLPFIILIVATAELELNAFIMQLIGSERYSEEEEGWQASLPLLLHHTYTFTY